MIEREKAAECGRAAFTLNGSSWFAASSSRRCSRQAPGTRGARHPAASARLARAVRMASADEILRRSTPARPPTDADISRRVHRALQLGWSIRTKIGETYTGSGTQRACTTCMGTGAISCGFCGGKGMAMVAEGNYARARQCVVCSGHRRRACQSCAGTGAVAAWAVENGALGENERRLS